MKRDGKKGGAEEGRGLRFHVRKKTGTGMALRYGHSWLAWTLKAAAPYGGFTYGLIPYVRHHSHGGT